MQKQKCSRHCALMGDSLIISGPRSWFFLPGFPLIEKFAYHAHTIVPSNNVFDVLVAIAIAIAPKVLTYY